MFDATLDVKEPLLGLAAMAGAGTDLRPVWKKLRPEIKLDIRANFVSKSGPSGPWEVRKDSTLSRGVKRAGKSRTLRKKWKAMGMKASAMPQARLPLGRLRQAWLYELSPSEMLIRHRIAWADVHETGGRAGKDGRAKIPQRQFAWLSDGMLERLTKACAAHVSEAW